MLIETRSLDFALTDAIRRHVESRVEMALGPVARWVRNVVVRVDDVNAGRGGVDKRCRIVATLRNRRSVVAEATHEDLYAAVDDAAARLRRSALVSVRRPITRQRAAAVRPGALAASAW